MKNREFLHVLWHSPNRCQPFREVRRVTSLQGVLSALFLNNYFALKDLNDLIFVVNELELACGAFPQSA